MLVQYVLPDNAISKPINRFIYVMNMISCLHSISKLIGDQRFFDKLMYSDINCLM